MECSVNYQDVEVLKAELHSKAILLKETKEERAKLESELHLQMTIAANFYASCLTQPFFSKYHLTV
jgi:hypothetical protein